jgi:hypothetical protein
LLLHGLDPCILVHHPRLNVTDDGLAAFMDVNMLDLDRLMRAARPMVEALCGNQDRYMGEHWFCSEAEAKAARWRAPYR